MRMRVRMGLTPEGEGQQGEEDGQKARGEARVDERDGRLEDALVGARQIDEYGDRRIDTRQVDRVDASLP